MRMRYGGLINSFLLLLIFTIQPVNADISAVDAGAEMVADGIDTSMMRMSNEMFRVGNESTAFIDEYGVVRTGIFNFATYQFNPFDVETVRKYQVNAALIAVLVAVFYILLGGGIAQLVQACPVQATQVFGKQANTFSIRNYTINVFCILLCLVFMYVFVLFVLYTNYVFTQLTMLDVLDSITPSISNIIMYFMMALCYLTLALFFAIRLIYIVIFSAFCLPIGVLLIPKISRPYAVAATWYFVQITFMQFVIVAITSVGVSLIDGMGLLGMLPTTGPTLYLGLILILLVVSIKFTIGFGIVKKGFILAKTIG